MSSDESKRDDLIYEIVNNRYDQEWKRTNDLDSKASSVTGFAGLLATLTGSINEFFPECNYQWLFLVPLTLFIGSAILGLWAYWTQSFKVINPQTVISRYSTRTRKELLMAVASTTSEHTIYNYSLNDTKVKRIRIAFAILVLAIGLFFVFSLVNLVM